MNVHVTRGAEGLDRRAFTVDEVQRMLEAGILNWEDRFELIAGEIVPMNAQSMPHFLLKSRLGVRIGRMLDSGLDIGIDGTVQMGSDGLFEPDIVIMKRQKLAPRTFVSITDALVVIEVADASIGRDMGIKAKAYAAAGLPELWVLDLSARVTHVHRDPSADGYGAITKAPFDDTLQARALDLSLRIADLED